VIKAMLTGGLVANMDVDTETLQGTKSLCPTNSNNKEYTRSCTPRRADIKESISFVRKLAKDLAIHYVSLFVR